MTFPRHFLATFLLCLVVFTGRTTLRAQDTPGGTADVTKAVQAALKDNSLDITVNNEAFGDPAPTQVKKLKVDYTAGGVAGSKTVFEYATLKIRPAHGKLVVTKAIYGDLPNERKVDVTGVVASAVQDNKVSLAVNNESLHGDPAPAVGKALEVNYTVGGKPCQVVVSEGDTLALPLSKDGTGPLVVVGATYGVL